MRSIFNDKTKRVLIACEESQEVCKAFRERGFKAFSCDLQEPSGGHPEWHILGDALAAVQGGQVSTMDGQTHDIGKWDLLIAHPPCTYLTAASAVRLYGKGKNIKDHKRYAKGEEAARFFMSFFEASCERVVIENPVPLKCFGLPGYSQIIEPFMFGEPWRKRTCLWLKNVPKLTPTKIVQPKGLWVGATCASRAPGIYTRYELPSDRDPKRRAKTFTGIAKAMAEQWGDILNEDT